MDLLQITVVLGILLILAILFGRYLAQAFSWEVTNIDRIFGGFERIIYKVSGIQVRTMTWKQYA
ncbi:potassium-transporting ATPase subunit KdpA, partial [Brevibacillus laterosporus]